MKRSLIFGALIICLLACAHRRIAGSFRVVPATPDYLLRSPDSQETPFRELLNHYNGFVPGKDWLDLRPRMELRVENAYYQMGAPKRGLDGYLGTEVAQYQIRPNGRLRLLTHQSLPQRPSDQAPVQELLDSKQQHHPYYRFFFEILFKDPAGQRPRTRGSVLLGAASPQEIDHLTTELLAAPDTVCGPQSTHCTVFPEACSVSLEMEIAVNGAPRVVTWMSSLASIANNPQHVELLRLHGNVLTPVEIDASDPQALRLPLLPGDRITWN
jgi:hypothetical protein